ncbi:MAG: aldolase catalytic domain-containing protein [Lachnospiraceae bacterium]|nr:aldolase catalytic domain-containing protein [Lachnospiraceae bacterium]
MNDIRLLDCTLRDGGYINDWNFGYHVTRDIIRKQIEAGTDFVEVGFLRDCEYDRDRVLFNSCSEILPILPEQRGRTRFSAMALHNKYDIRKLEEYDGKSIDILRVTFHDYDIDEGLAFIREAIAKGYQVYCNPINIMGYSDDMILRLIEKVNRIRPAAFSIVDTFGAMMKPDLLRIYSLIEHDLDPSVTIGIHLHENLALSFSLAQEFLNMKAPRRNCVIDGSMLGMGRVPGNLCIELIMDYLNRNLGATYDVNPILDGIDDHIMAFKAIEPWGYSTAYALSAKYNLHRNYAEYLLGKGRLRAKQINQILASVDASKKTAYDEAYIEELYEGFQNNEVDDKELVLKLKETFRDRDVLILAPGASIVREKEEIDSFIEKKHPLIISANFVPEDYPQDYVFCSNAMRYNAIEEKLSRDTLLATSNLIPDCDAENVLNYADLCHDEKGKCDNCVIMLLKLLLKAGKKKVFIAGFDGYREDGGNYAASYMASQHTKGETENIRNRRYLEDIRKQMEVTFLTESLYI